MKQLRAFTLIETIISLTIISITILISINIPKDFFHKQEILFFENTLNQNFKYFKEKAILQNLNVLIIFSRQDNQIIMKDIENNKVDVCIQIPKFLIIKQNISPILISGEKGIAPISIYFYDLYNKINYRLTMQMGWGTLNFVKL